MFEILKSQRSYMTNTYITINEKFPRGLIELYFDVDTEAKKLAIPYMIVGAMARDLVLVHGFDAKIERGTRDVDFGICVESWEQFHSLATNLITVGFIQDEQVSHRFYRNCSDGLPWELDIVPFGEIADDNNIAWPPKGDFVMNVLGFQEALDHVWKVRAQEDPELVLPVCSPVGIALLKLIAWLDRESDKRRKDATDLLYLICTYSKIPSIYDALFDEGYMDAQDYDDLKASACKLGTDIAAISSAQAKDFLNQKLFDDEALMDVLGREMKTGSKFSNEKSSDLLKLLAKPFK
ncbi:nucleotidyl transferase AbiEii/AbiGii toxin family protein [Vibrio sp. MACH09]|uniref:nucleotidyl transferase AbiEii/AbiGii toxin family protein n=1 Tax=Vibrio sp. MACH09 TaxID=3025122 RepID=UPI00295F32F1|nr:nucleotidyl transferase AbiEii/AbiGii toxin family protein [Vibrio sp. MACH09]